MSFDRVERNYTLFPAQYVGPTGNLDFFTTSNSSGRIDIINSLFAFTIAAPGSTSNNQEYSWSNVRIPSIEDYSSRSYYEDDWYITNVDPGAAYASLVGMPNRLPKDDSLDFNFHNLYSQIPELVLNGSKMSLEDVATRLSGPASINITRHYRTGA